MRKITPDHYAALLFEWTSLPDESLHTRLNNLAKWMAKKGHHPWLPKIERSLKDLAKRNGEVLEMELSLPKPLSQTQEKEVNKEIKTRFGKNVELIQKIDSSLLGGARVRIGDRAWDASFRSQLEQLTQRLTR